MYLLELDVYGELLNNKTFITSKLLLQLDISNGVLKGIGLPAKTPPDQQDLNPKEYANDKLVIIKQNYQQALVSYFRREITTNYLKKNIGKQFTKDQFDSLLKEICDDYIDFIDKLLHQFSVGYGDWVLTAIQAQDYGHDYVERTNLNFLVHQELGLKTNIYLDPVPTRSNKIIVNVSLYSDADTVCNSASSSIEIYGSTTYVISRNQNPSC